MRWFLLCLLGCGSYAWVFAQPPNDICTTAQFIDMGAVLDCDSTRSLSITGSNIDAIPSDPFPDVDCGGTSPADVSPDVWYAFTAPANSFTISAHSSEIDDLFLAVYSGDDCSQLAFRACNIGTPAGLVLSTIPGDTYFVSLAGSGPDDVGSFEIEFDWLEDCAPCFDEQSGFIQMLPNKDNYACGEEVQICFTLTDWSTSGSIEWFHSLVPTFGSGWDLTTIEITQLPESCSNDGGFWDWYPTGWSSCQTGEFFPFGFAYESGEGNAVGPCSGSAADGNPGNNWGDGLGCTDGNFPDQGYTFCWRMNVKQCPPNSDVFNGEDLSIELAVYTDGDSGSWNSVGCNNGTTFAEQAVVTLCSEQAPFVEVQNPSCPDAADGILSIVHDSMAAIPVEFFDYFLYDIDNQIIDSCTECGEMQLFDSLPAGSYSLTWINNLGLCFRSVIVDIAADPAPVATIEYTPTCIGTPLELQGSVDSTGATEWLWYYADTLFATSPTIITSDTGRYELVVIVDGCASDTAAVNAQFLPFDPQLMVSDTTPCENAELILTASGGTAYSWLGPNGPIITTDSSITVANTALVDSGTYSVVIQDSLTGCTEAMTVDIDILPNPQVNLGGPLPLCVGTSATFTASGAESYVWQDDLSTQNPRSFAPAAPGILSLSVVGTAANGCTDERTAEFFVNPAPTASIIATEDSICLGDSTTLLAAGGAVVEWSDGQTAPIIGITPESSQTYWLIVENMAGCQDSAFIDIQAINCDTASCPDLQIDIQNLSDSFCLDNAGGQISLVANLSGQVDPEPVLWSGAGVFGTNFNPDLAGPGQHSIVATVSDQACLFSDSIIYSVFEQPDAGFTIQANRICLDETVTVSLDSIPSSTAIYDWDFGGAEVLDSTSAGSYILSPPNAGTFYIHLLVTDNGCTSAASIDSLQVDAPLDTPEIICANTELNQITFEWNDIANADSFELTILPSGISFFQDITTYTANDLLPGEGLTIEVVAFGQTVCGPSATASQTCSASPCPDLTITLPQQPVPFCFNQDPVMLSGTPNGGNGGTVTWSGPGVIGDIFDPTISGLGLQTILYEYEEAGPCTLTDSFQIEVLPVPTNTFSLSTEAACVGQSITVEYTGTATEAANYFWDFGDADIIDGSGAGPYQISFEEAGTQFVSLIVVENACQQAPETVEIDILEPLAEPVISCIDRGVDQLTFIWDAVPGAVGYQVEILGSGEVNTQTDTSFNLFNLQPDEVATIRVQALGEGPCGNGEAVEASCSALSCPAVVINTITESQTFCQGHNSDLIILEAGIESGQTDGNFEWSGPGVSLVEDQFVFEPAGLPEGNYELTVIYTTNDFCSYQAELSMLIEPVPVANAGADQSLTCSMGMVSLNGSASDNGQGFTYLWTHENGDTDISNPTNVLTEVSRGGMYTLRVTSSSGCFAEDQVFVNADIDIPVPDIELSQVSCFAENDGLIRIRSVEGGTPPFTYMLNGQSVDNSGFYPGLAPGEYSLRITGANGCFSEVFLDLTEPDELRLSLLLGSAQEPIESGDLVTVLANISGGNTIDTLIWEPDSLAENSEANVITFAATETTRIRLTVIDELGCQAQDDLLLVVEKNRPIFIPTAISPNGDNINDRFTIYADQSEIVEIRSLQIFSRWGELVYDESNFPPNDPSYGWDGTHRGQPLGSGVFIYSALVRFSDGEEIQFSGDLNLIH